MIDKSMTVNELLRSYPQVQALLEKYYIDYCCGGHRTLEEVAKEHGFDLNEFLEEVRILITKLNKGA
ncbi:MAG: DUF542 domain-containing protein [Hydrogenobacter thermophilus]|uniref:Iron-sulfur cluster repair di-iron protein n=1 Tax=Hydrogenobacter thermophilus (strain DSM 6534 / IAM 12695 / TK-6) TaxID=608538 RepID=D3DIP3_HYDTT|nr:DUF542 domain-containing protein [Hydrogenobacter thermophilus]ADO45621.1 protein of unknown function DUF542 ScdA domain protein [Hydrogenobacter thermophilus TK-6]MCS7285482.1 DUF542 domain-containing protein [Hydrogenobacter thermophilus]QWK20546.1 MAG: DUF542 domain-containing protein [Hydrogenobacter thermophilus]BAI69695.1 hypothetical protein HTH_1241 [Hydrogenobacter thermophilus TK-6]